MHSTPISIKDLRNTLAETIEQVAVGKQTFTITKFGKAKAYLVPIPEQKVSPSIAQRRLLTITSKGWQK